MVCPKCGSNQPDGSKFCNQCGKKLTGREKVADASSPAPEKKVKSKKKAVAISAVAALLVASIVVSILAFLPRPGGNPAYVYLSDGTYELLTNLKKNQPVELAALQVDWPQDELVTFSPDGKYIYYYTEFDEWHKRGTLCRAEYAKLGADSKKNDNYIDVIADKVYPDFHCLENGTLVYHSDEALYYYDGKASQQIAQDVAFFDTDEDRRLVYTAKENHGLYGLSLDNLEKKVMLASNVFVVSDTADFDNILYTKREADGSETLCATGFGKDTQELGKKVKIWGKDDGTGFFLAENDTGLNLYDYVDDSRAQEDAGLTEPMKEDFEIPDYNYRMISGENLNEADFGELYTSCVRGLYWYGHHTADGWTTSMEKSLLTDHWGEDAEGIREATRHFINTYKKEANSIGYIPVTEEVKAALQEIQKCSDTAEEEWQWLWLCFEKYEDGTTTDRNSYNVAHRNWDQAEERNHLRELLKSKENEHPVYTLYRFENGELTTISDSVLNTQSYAGGILFNTVDMVTDTLPLNGISSVNRVHELFDYSSLDENYVTLWDGTTCRISPSAAKTIGSKYTHELYFTNKEVYMHMGDGNLYMAPITDGVVGDFRVIAEYPKNLSFDGTTLYYTSDHYMKENGVIYCNLYSVRNGSTTCLAKDIMNYQANLYADGTILCYTGRQVGRGLELTIIAPGGKATIVADGVTQYIRVDEDTLLYLSDGDLYCYNGKEKVLVHQDVEKIWSRDEMEILQSLCYYNATFY